MVARVRIDAKLQKSRLLQEYRQGKLHGMRRLQFAVIQVQDPTITPATTSAVRAMKAEAASRTSTGTVSQLGTLPEAGGPGQIFSF